MVRDSLATDPEEIEEEIRQTGASSKIDINKRLFYEVLYHDGTICKVSNKPRQTRVHFYCDQYRNEKDSAMAVIDISEPDYCEYLFKVSTKFMCAAGTQFKKASVKLHTEDYAGQVKPDLDLDAGSKTVRKNLACTVKSDF